MLLSLLMMACAVVLSSAQMDGQMDNQIDDQMVNQMDNQMDTQMDGQVDDQMDGQMDDRQWLPESGPVAELEDAWATFKLSFVRNYTGQTEEMKRKKIFAENLKSINENNELYSKGLKTFTMEVNQFADMDDSEFMNLMTDSVAPEELSGGSELPPEARNLTYPSYFDWRTRGYVTRVKSQGSCGSGWAFSATGALEGQYYRRTGRLVSLSEQQLLDCSEGNYGCYGGWPDVAFAYITKNHGIDMESYYRYAARDGCCRYRCSYRGALCRSYVKYLGISEYSLLVQLYHVGPLSVAIDASHRSFRFYRSGVYYEPYCKTALGQLNHKMLLVGYGTCMGRPYWSIKNSFGTRWGMSGYIRMSRNRYNNCGISSYMSYPVV